MKLLTGLAIAQFALMGLLFARVIALESTLEERAPQTTRAAASTVSLTASPALPPSDSRAFTITTLDEERLRAIIREELKVVTAPVAVTSPPAAAEPDPQQEIEYDLRRDDVQQTLDYYTQTGQISDAEMLRLQSDIARLRPADREAMLRRLIRELNNGAIDGRL